MMLRAIFNHLSTKYSFFLAASFFVVLSLFVSPRIVNAAVLETISGSFTSTNGDAAHNFKPLEDKLGVALPKWYQKGFNPKITRVTADVQSQGSSAFITTYEAVIEESTDGNAWMGFTARGSFGNTASAKCPADPNLENYQIRAAGQISGCENADGLSLEQKLISSPTTAAGMVETITMYDNPTVRVREYFIGFTKPSKYPPIADPVTPTTPTTPTPPAGGTTTPRANFSYAADPTVVKVKVNGSFQYNEVVSIVSTTDQASLLINATPPTGDPVGTYASFKANVPTSVYFGNLKPNTIYTVSVAGLKPTGTTIGYQTIATLPAFDTTYVAPTVPQKITFRYVQEPQLKQETVAGTTNYKVILSVLASEAQLKKSISIQPPGDPSLRKRVDVNFVSGSDPVNVIFSDVRPDQLYEVTIVDIDSDKVVQKLDSFTINSTNGIIVMTSIANPVASNPDTTPAPAPKKEVDPKKAAVQEVGNGQGQCMDGIDNDGDGKADYYGVDKTGPNGVPDGVLDIEPDPACISVQDPVEEPDDVKSSLIPCTNKCTFSDVIRLINNIISFFFTVLLIPLFVIMIIYAGYRYLMAQGNPGQHAKLLSMAKHLVLGLLLILCAWLIVHVVLTTIGYKDYTIFFD